MASVHAITATFLLLLALPAVAQELPDAPQPHLGPPVRLKTEPKPAPFFDRHNNIALAASFSVRLADTIQTCRMMRKRLIVTVPAQSNGMTGGMFVFPYFHEGGAPVDSCAGIAGFNAGIMGASAGTSWLLNKTGHHKLQNLPNWISVAGSAYGIIRNSRYPHPRLAGFPPGTTYKVR